MDRETAVRMWREIGSGMPGGGATGRLIEAFAVAVEAAERERCAKLPLTDDEVLKMWRLLNFRGSGGQADWFAEGIRAAERAHGIGA